MQIQTIPFTEKPLYSLVGFRAWFARKPDTTSSPREYPITKRTSLLVLSDGFRGASRFDDFLTTDKAVKAWRYRERGQPIEFWSEIDFVKALTEANVAEKRPISAGSR
jgi:hypothetical protein